jgi:hypothetical protein
LTSSSFLGVNESLTTSFLATGAKKRKRYTEDGRLCATAYVQDGQTFFDCTPSRSPDGQMKNKEWCYVDAKERGEKPWNYCKPIMDYDKLREANQEEMKTISVEMRKTESEVSTNIVPSQQALDNLKKTKQGQAEIDSKINKLVKEISTLEVNMKNLFSIKEVWSKEEEKAVLAATEARVRKDKAKEEQENTPPTKMEITDDTLQKENANDKCVINPFYQEKIKEISYDCAGKLLYEEDSIGDGLNGQYYDNEFLIGDYKEQIDSVIDFDWSGTSPLEGLSAAAFSVKWSGFIYIPITSKYVFSVQCDDGAIISINDKIILSHNFIVGEKESKDRVDRWFTDESNKRKNPAKNFSKGLSDPIILIGGSKYRIVVSYSHTIHNNFQEDDQAFFNLSWSNDEWEDAVIPQAYLYSENSYSPLKISGISSELAIIRKLYENDLAFKNSDEYILQDIPNDYRGSNSLKLNTKYMGNDLTFVINIPIYVYIGSLDFYPHPLPDNFEDTNQTMSLLHVNKSFAVAGSKMIYADRSGVIKIFRKKFEAGKVNIKLDKKNINEKGIPMIVFFGSDATIATPITCGGEDFLISKPGSDHFKSCSSSSQFNTDYKCEYALNDKNVKDGPGNAWATKGEGVNSWLEVNFTSLYEILRIDFFNRRNPAERNQEIEIEFSNGTIEQFKLKNIDTIQTIKFEDSIRSTSIKFKITKVYGTINNGGAFRVYGVKCTDPDALKKSEDKNPKLQPLFKIEDKSLITLNCSDSLINSKKFNSVIKKPGSEVEVFCPEWCSLSNYNIYGDDNYSKDSVICKAAAHSLGLNGKEGKVKIIFGAGLKSYKSQNKNGIVSKSKGKSDFSIKFMNVNKNDDIILDKGNRVDYKDNKGKWKKAMIDNIKDIKDSKVLVLSIEDGEPGIKPVELTYPNDRISPCGEHTKGRDCNSSRKKPSNNPIKIRFAPKGEKTEGDYLWDRGAILGKDGPFGWSMDMISKIKTRSTGTNPLHKYIAEFNPSSKSRWCTKESSDVMCDNVTWSVRAGLGKFNVKVHVGDSQDNVRIDLKINDIYLIRGKTVGKGDLKVFEGNFESVNEFLTLNSECEEDCDYAMAKINMIEIYPYLEEDETPIIKETPEKFRYMW